MKIVLLFQDSISESAVIHMEALIRKLDMQGSLVKDEIVCLLTNMDEAAKKDLFERAHRKRLQYYGDRVYLRGLIEFSNRCRKDCLYCGIRASNREVERYRLTAEEILDCCEDGYRLGFRSFVLQSGEDLHFTGERLAGIIREIKRQYQDAAVTLSVGERSEAEYRMWREAGADRFLMRHETASEQLYEALHPDSSFQNRMESIQLLKRIGYQVGAGFMVGLPGQTARHLAEDLLFLHELQPDMIGIGPFIPHRHTPLGGAKGGTLDDTLVMIALTRLFVPESLMPATTAIGTIHPLGRESALKAGANVVMPNLSPRGVRSKYELYDDKICTGDESAQCKNCIELRIRSAGFQPDSGRGDSYRWIKKAQML